MLKSFPVKIPTLWRQAFPGVVLGAAVGRISLWIQGEPFSLLSTAPLMAVAAVIVAAVHFLQPTQAGPQGLNLMQSWGFRRAVPWAAVRDVSFARLYLLQPSMRLTDTQGRVYWIARDTKDLKGLHALALEHAGATHPLTRALETPLFAL